MFNSDKMNRTNPKKPIKKYHKMCTLEAIAEDKVLENFKKDTNRVVTNRDAINKTPDNNFTPFLSSWRSRSVKTQKTTKPTSLASKGNLRQEYESLKSDHKELLESSRLQELKNQAILTKLEELEEECQNLRFQAEENIRKITSERKNSEQMKTDYEFLLETQHQTFKRREKELLEQIDKCAEKIDADTQTSTEHGLATSIINSFEYEEITEKLQSFEKQNKFLQSSKDDLELQNKILKEKFANLRENFTSIKLKHNEREVISNKINLESNTTNDELFFNQPKLMGIIDDCEAEKNKSFQFEQKPFEETASQMQKELRFACETVPDILDEVDDTLESVPKASEIHTQFDDSSDDILNLLPTCLTQVNTLHHIERNNTENKLEVVNDNSATKQIEIKNMNLSDSEKINKNNIFIGPPEKSKVQNSDFIMQQLKLQYKNDKRNYTELKEVYKNTQTTLSKKNKEILELLAKNEDILGNNEKLKKENHSQKIEYDKLECLLKEKEEIIHTMADEQMVTETEQENSFERIRYLKSLINNHKTQLKELCDLLTNTNSETLQNNIENLKNSELNEQPSESENVSFKSEEHTEKINNFSQRKKKQTLENEEHIKNNIEECDQNLLILKEKFSIQKYENETLKGAISKMTRCMQDMKKIFINFKQIFVKETMQQIQILKCDFLEAKSLFEHTIRLVEKEIQNNLPTKSKDTESTEKQVASLIEDNTILKYNTKINEKGQQSEGTNCKNKILGDKLYFINTNGLDTNINKVLMVQTKNFNIEKESRRTKMQNSIQARTIEPIISDEYKKEDKWKLLRTKEHDSRRNIDLNALS